MIETHLPVLQILLPLLAAPLCVLIRQKTAVWGFATAVTWGAQGIAWRLLNQVRAHGPISYELGGWEPPFGIEYRIDTLNAFVLVIVTLVASIVATILATTAVTIVVIGRPHF